jgi:hypothetical protein
MSPFTEGKMGYSQQVFMFLELKQIFPKVERLICKICGL